ncbi:caspase family protein [Mariprofundus sp. KV]|uniref:caspase family protein n=1 Tax=Mariprofundus sp. KV TaxID=2608715 RepID=UPI0015A4B9AC|nr:caspase family protein [Mariprofundus sp. KV]NWF35139.1 caspase family protein [Mariprofundus sp. KV]
MNRIAQVFMMMTMLISSASYLQAATGHALIVGVSEYPNLPEQYHLNGPKYDSEMLFKFLKTQRFRSFPESNITMLADGVDGSSGNPTRAAILHGLKTISKKAAEGDFVYLHFSGHGSRQPAKKGDMEETDGLDELFLPSDIGAWDDAIGEVKNALVDDEIGNSIAAIRAKGAFVWAVFDSCHSGTVTRGALGGEDVKMRKVPASALGVPQQALDKAESNRVKTRGHVKPETALGNVGGDSRKAGFVAFYAAQTTEQTPEMRLPAGEEGRVPHGLFSFTILQVISEYPSITYRQAAQEVLQRYAASYMDRPTPLFEGDLDATVFGVTAKADKPQWPIELKDDEIHIAAGSISRLSVGSILAIMESPAAADESALGYLTVSNSESMDSALQPIAFRNKKVIEVKAMPEHAYARLVERKMNFSIRVAKPEQSSPQVKKALDSMQAADDSGLRVTWVKAGESADIRLAEKDKQLWLVPPTGELIASGENKSPSITLEGKDNKALSLALADNLARIARVLNLLKVSQGMGAGSSGLEANLIIKRKTNGQSETISIDSVPRIHPGDAVYLSAKNPGEKAVDLNVLFVGSDYSISHWFKGRIHPNGRLGGKKGKKGLFKASDSSFGTERIILIASQAKEETMVQDLSFLAQRAMPKTRGTGDGSGVSALLKSAGFGHAMTRGVEPMNEDDEGGSSSILQFTVHTTAAP